MLSNVLTDMYGLEVKIEYPGLPDLFVHKGFLDNLTGDYDENGEVKNSKSSIENMVIRYENEKN